MKRVEELGIVDTPWTTCDWCAGHIGIADTSGYVVGEARNLKIANIMASAPELYECLREAVENMEEIECDPDGCAVCLNNVDCIIPKFRAALAKAGGKEK